MADFFFNATVCPPVGYTQQGDKYYKHVAATANHVTARANCEADNAWLAMFKTTADYNIAKCKKCCNRHLGKYGNCTARND